MFYIKEQGSSSINKLTDLNSFPPCYDSIIEKAVTKALFCINRICALFVSNCARNKTHCNDNVLNLDRDKIRYL